MDACTLWEPPCDADVALTSPVVALTEPSSERPEADADALDPVPDTPCTDSLLTPPWETLLAVSSLEPPLDALGTAVLSDVAPRALRNAVLTELALPP